MIPQIPKRTSVTVELSFGSVVVQNLNTTERKDVGTIANRKAAEDCVSLVRDGAERALLLATLEIEPKSVLVENIVSFEIAGGDLLEKVDRDFPLPDEPEPDEDNEKYIAAVAEHREKYDEAIAKRDAAVQEEIAKRSKVYEEYPIERVRDMALKNQIAQRYRESVVHHANIETFRRVVRDPEDTRKRVFSEPVDGYDVLADMGDDDLEKLMDAYRRVATVTEDSVPTSPAASTD